MFGDIITPPNVSSENNIKLKSFASPDIIGDSIAMKNIFGILEKVSPTNERVLIYGENGTGKELIARTFASIDEDYDDNVNFVYWF